MKTNGIKFGVILGACFLFSTVAVSFEIPGVLNPGDFELSLFKRYMGNLEKGAGSPHQLASWVKVILAKHYDSDWSKVKYDFSGNQPADNATTDCTVIYFNNQAMVSALDKLPTEFTLTNEQVRWLLHEVGHTEQCKKDGSRDEFGRRWIRDAKSALMRSNAWLDPSDNTMNSMMKEIHDKQAMEKATEDKALRLMAEKTVLNELKAHFGPKK